MSEPKPITTPEPPIDINAVRDALKDIPGIVRVVHTRTQHDEEVVWIIRDEVNIDRDRLIVEAMVDLDVADWHFASVRTQGMVPHGHNIL